MSLADELRAIRGGVKFPDKRLDQHGEPDRPWKSDLERVEQTLLAALQTISEFSGVELPGAAAKKEGGSASRFDSTTLKDRIRNDLEAFSSTAVSQMSKQAELQARAALEVIHYEMQNRIEQAIGEYRDKLHEQIEPRDFEINVARQSQERVADLVRAQTDEFARWVWLTCKGTGTPIPLQIEKLLEPYVEEATALMTGSIHQKVQELLTEQEKAVEERFKGTADAVQNQITALEQTAHEVCERNVDAVTRTSAERLNAVADAAAKRFDVRLQARVEEALGGVQPRLDDETAALLDKLHEQQDRMAQDFIRRVEALTSEAQATMGSKVSALAEQSVSKAMDASLHKLQQSTDGAVQQIQEAGQSAQGSVEQGVARVREMLGGAQDLNGFREKIVSDCKEQISSLVEEAVGAMEPRILQHAERKLEAAGALIGKSQEEAAGQFESLLHEMSEVQYRELLGRIQKSAGEAGAQAAAEVRRASESVVHQLSEKVDSAAVRLQQQHEQSKSGFETSMRDSLEASASSLRRLPGPDSTINARRFPAASMISRSA